MVERISAEEVGGELEIMGENWNSVLVFQRQRWEREIIAGMAGGATIYTGISRSDLVATLDAFDIRGTERRQVFDDVIEMEHEAREILNRR